MFPQFAIRQEASLPTLVHSAPFPRALLPRLERAWKSNPDAKSRRLPTRTLRQLVECVEPHVLAVSDDLEDPQWVRALQQPQNEIALQLALEAWITTKVAPHQPDVDWSLSIKAAMPLAWTCSDVDLLRHRTQPNGTAAPDEPVFALLASFLAGTWVDEKHSLPGQKRGCILGPVDARGKRSVYAWPPQELTHDGAYGLWTHYLTFQVTTMPHDGRILLLASPHIARFAGTPAGYIPRTSHKPAGATLFLHAPHGVLRGAERPALLSCPISVHGQMDRMTWSWDSGLATILPSLPTPHLYPDPNAVRAAPREHARLDEPSTPSGDTPSEPAALLLHATGYTYLPMEAENTEADTPSTPEGKRPRLVQHPAGTGYQPIDHLQLFEHLSGPLGDQHFEPLSWHPTLPGRRPPRLRPPAPTTEYHLELWRTSPRTEQAVHLVLTRKLGFEHTAPPPGDDQIHTYRGPCVIHLRVCDPGTLTSGLTRPAPALKKKDRQAFRKERAAERVAELGTAFPKAGPLTGCLVEIEKPGYFAAAGRDDPYRLLKQTLPGLHRHVQCLHPVNRTANAEAKKKSAQPYQDSDIRSDDIERVSAAIADILRSVGNLPELPPLPGLKAGVPYEVSTIWVGHEGKNIVPMLLRMHSLKGPTAQLIPTHSRPHEPEMPLEDLPEALTEGRGRIRRRDDHAALGDFLTQALALDSGTDRLFLARTQLLRDTQIWPWLQNGNITPDLLETPTASAAAHRTPSDLPGLRIARVCDDGTKLPLGFGVSELPAPQEESADSQDTTTEAPAASQDTDSPVDGYLWGRFSGVVPWNDRTFLCINPRPDTHQVNKALTKYSNQDKAATKKGANPNCLEVHASFLQDGDDASEFARYVQNLRRNHLHTDKATALPMLLHMGKLMAYYLN
ncbi:pPIWI_RE module domain-containing protein [Streptomyces sp. NPDC059849]|uniref:pPIWI_RE module domain-containing protein n=1 Tax=Streptomyces sp. NPDC059849 TaxID=3346969 RepID=UPI0036610C81